MVDHQVPQQALDVEVNRVAGVLLDELDGNLGQLVFDDPHEVLVEVFVLLDGPLGVAQQRQDLSPVRE